jgi:hypothetical protein
MPNSVILTDFYVFRSFFISCRGDFFLLIFVVYCWPANFVNLYQGVRIFHDVQSLATRNFRTQQGQSVCGFNFSIFHSL